MARIGLLAAIPLLALGCAGMSTTNVDAFREAVEEFELFEYEEFDIELEEVEAAGNLGFARGTYTFRLKDLADGQVMEYDGKYLTVFKKQPDGSWKIYRDCFNSNTP
jgi:ketosteroid isomerase-like protein